ncbi:MAG TPA: F-box protein [Rhabdochlamydiaceae bacterium]|nr:F-box protein [Rhabdochlamydiaceae bacterium]
MFNITYDFEYEIPKFQEPLKSYHPPDLPEDALIEIASFLRLEVRHRIFRLVCRSFRNATKKCGNQLPHDKKERIFKLFDRKILSFFGGQLNLMRIPMIQLSALQLQSIKTHKINMFELGKKTEQIYVDNLKTLSVSFGIVPFYLDYQGDKLAYALFGRVRDLSDVEDEEGKITSILMYPAGSGYIFYEQTARYYETVVSYLSDLYRRIPRGHLQTFTELIDPRGGIGGWGNNLRMVEKEGPKLTADKKPMVSLY